MSPAASKARPRHWHGRRAAGRAPYDRFVQARPGQVFQVFAVGARANRQSVSDPKKGRSLYHDVRNEGRRSNGSDTFRIASSLHGISGNGRQAEILKLPVATSRQCSITPKGRQARAGRKTADGLPVPAAAVPRPPWRHRSRASPPQAADTRYLGQDRLRCLQGGGSRAFWLPRANQLLRGDTDRRR